MAKVKVFVDKQWMDRQTDKWTVQKLCAPDLSMPGHKKEKMLVTSIFSFPPVRSKVLLTWGVYSCDSDAKSYEAMYYNKNSKSFSTKGI